MKSDSGLLICATILIILLSGDPDLLDAIIERLRTP